MENGQEEKPTGQGRVRRFLGLLARGLRRRSDAAGVPSADDVLEEMDSVPAARGDGFSDAVAETGGFSAGAEGGAVEDGAGQTGDAPDRGHVGGAPEEIGSARKSLFRLIRRRASGPDGRILALTANVGGHEAAPDEASEGAGSREAQVRDDGTAEIVIEEGAAVYADEADDAHSGTPFASGPESFSGPAGILPGKTAGNGDGSSGFPAGVAEPTAASPEAAEAVRPHPEAPSESLEEVIGFLEAQAKGGASAAGPDAGTQTTDDAGQSPVTDTMLEPPSLPAPGDIGEEAPTEDAAGGSSRPGPDFNPDSETAAGDQPDGSTQEETLPVILRTDGTPLPRHRLGEYVYHKGLITATALDAASREQAVTGERIGQILVANGFLSDKERVKAILANSSERIAQENVSRSRIPSDLLDEFNIMISAETEDTIYVSTMRDEDVVERIVREYYGDKQIQFVSFLPSSMNSFIAAMKKSSAIDDATQTKETMLDRILYRALNEGASDIHIIPRRKSYTTMFRLLGVRRLVHEGALDEYRTMIAQIKDKARMDLAERRKPQDGGFQIEYNGKMIDLRVATLPTEEGETCIMRVLDPDRVQPSLGDLGITDVEKWRKGFNQQHGLCLICGPTGSGKTTTLNSSIKEMDRFGKAIYTIEDPVEYRIPYVGQVSVNTSVGLDFATAVRAYMRADPDVIVLGEVRDEETARNAIKAADTGHLVLATLHTGSIHGAVSRLKDLGIAPRELRYLLRSVLVQSLVRTTCGHCDGAGCLHCNGSGYSGRTVVSECEYFEDYAQVDRIIDSSETEVVRTWPTMIEDAIKKHRQGITDLDELYRVFGAAVDVVLRKEEEAA